MNAALTLIRRVRRKPPRELAAQFARRFSAWADVASLEFPLLPGDVADSRSPTQPVPDPPLGRAPRVAWVVVPPGPGSGGHTTLFRMIRAAVDSGMECTLLFYDRYSGDFHHNSAVVREWWPWLDVDIRPVESEIVGFDAVIASSWITAHVIRARGRGAFAALYFVQDFEPYFYPRGGVYAMAEDSYRFGFRTIALGGMVHRSLERELGVASELVEFGLDTDVYRPLGTSAERSGVVYYARNNNDRRGQPLAIRALELFHRDRPAEPIHIYGDRIANLPFPAEQHGSLSTAQLNALYNQVVGGIALSFTNVSLVPEEMLAAGAIPVVNDGWMPRAGLADPSVVWALPTPLALADALRDVVDAPDRAARAAAAADGVVRRSWNDTGARVAAIIRDQLGVG